MEPAEPERTPPAVSGLEPGTVEVEPHAPNVVVVTLRGEHDLTTKQLVSEALARAGTGADVLVDLSECSFIDSTIIGVLVLALQAQTELGRRLELAIAPDARAVQRVATIAGLATFLSIHDTRSAGLASIQSN
jgi:anti-anti-sigma factor